MKFTWDAYRELLHLLVKHGYAFRCYDDYDTEKRCVILRHDIDNDPIKALKMAQLENRYGAVSTYFVLVTSDFYNVLSRHNAVTIQRIQRLGHHIGLHFDETRYPQIAQDHEAMQRKIRMEADILACVTGVDITSVSMHRPSQGTLEANWEIPGMVNSYSNVFFRDFKYLSDSRRRWREPVKDIIESEQYPRLHILTHAFWYNEAEKSIHDTLAAFVNRGSMDRYDTFRPNITDLASIMPETDVLQ